MPRLPVALIASVAFLISLPLAGCGLAPPAATGPVGLTVTSGFGSVRLLSGRHAVPATGDTVSKLLAGPLRLSGDGAGNLRAVLGRRAGGGSGWFLYVNGIAVLTAPAHTVLHPGDRVWLDLHPTAAGQVRAVVGAFPDPFVHGVAGKRLPATLECAPDTQRACDIVSRALSAIGIPSARQVPGTGSGTDTLGVVVGTVADLRAEVVSALIAQGPGASGVFAVPASGERLTLLDGAGHPAGTLPAGLLAATGDQVAEPTWVVTGTDPAEVAAAAARLAPAALQDRFAVAVVGGRTVPLPVSPAAPIPATRVPSRAA